ncbi:pentapeptide repeat-containing protein [Calothrix membranacea FACHB-236]|nr:pentapeptide repeat-containing protein [Calothrix membranacea FACHB-236]
MSRSCRASKVGLEKAQKAFKIRGWSQEYLAGVIGRKRQTIINFFARRKVDKSVFQAICTELDLEWGEIADLESEQLSRSDEDEIIQESSGTTQMLTDKKSYAFAIAGTVSPENISKLKAIAALLKELAQDASIKIVDIERGSIKLILEGSKEGLERLENLFRSGQLEDVLGVSVEDVEFVTSPDSNPSKKRLAFTIAGDVAESEIAILKAALIETSDDAVEQSERQNPISRSKPISRIYPTGNYVNRSKPKGLHLMNRYLRDRNQGFSNLRRVNLEGANLKGANLEGANLRGRNLSFANLRGANLRGANLSFANLRGANLRGANLRGANLRGANVSGALFGRNFGLTEDVKLDLVRRGAIFGDQPPVPSPR